MSYIKNNMGRAFINQKFGNAALASNPKKLIEHFDTVHAYDRDEFAKSFMAARETTAENSVAIVNVVGMIAYFSDPWMGIMSYDELADDISYAATQADKVILNVDSPGGTVQGMAEFMQFLGEAKQSIDISSHVSVDAASAAYWLVAQAGTINASPSAEVGSIGVYIQHQNIAKMMEMEGIENEFIQAGEFKTEGNPYEALSDEARAYLQSSVNDSYDEFVTAVAQGRDTSNGNVLASFGQGRMFSAKDALAVGMVDSIGTLDDYIAQIMPSGIGRMAQRDADVAKFAKSLGKNAK